MKVLSKTSIPIIQNIFTIEDDKIKYTYIEYVSSDQTVVDATLYTETGLGNEVKDSSIIDKIQTLVTKYELEAADKFISNLNNN